MNTKGKEKFEFSSIEDALSDLKKGKIIICTDDPDRENEGDFICAGEFATTENINFMAMHTRGKTFINRILRRFLRKTTTSDLIGEQ